MLSDDLRQAVQLLRGREAVTDTTAIAKALDAIARKLARKQKVGMAEVMLLIELVYLFDPKRPRPYFATHRKAEIKNLSQGHTKARKRIEREHIEIALAVHELRKTRQPNAVAIVADK